MFQRNAMVSIILISVEISQFTGCMNRYVTAAILLIHLFQKYTNSLSTCIAVRMLCLYSHTKT